MFITAEHHALSSFAVVDKYAVYDEDGRIHIGRTIRRFMDLNHIKYKGISDSIGMSRGGFSHLMDSKFIGTDRLHQVSKVLRHDFAQYLLSDETKEEIMKLKEPKAEYKPKPKKKKSPIKIVLEFSDDTDPDSPLIERLSKMIEEAQRAKDSEE